MLEFSTNLFQKVIFAFLSVLLLIGFCILMILLSPIYIFRWIVSKLQIICRPDLYKIVPASSAIFLQHGIEKTKRSNVQITLQLEGKVHPEDMAAKLTRVLLNSKSGGKLLFPEFKMFAEYWCGFPFWKMESNFKLEDHFKTEQIPANPSEEYISNYENNLIKIPFKYGKSPWKIILLEGKNSDSSYFIFKCHHSLGDGHAMFNILMKSVENCVQVRSPQQKVYEQNGVLWKLLTFTTFPIILAYEAVNYLHGFSRPHPWDISVKDMSPDLRVIVKSKRSISCKNMKIASVKHGVTFTTVLLAAITGSVHKFFERTKQNIPDFIMIVIPIPPSSDHPGTLKNQFAAMYPRLPVKETNRSLRLQKCKIQLDAAKSQTSVLPILSVNLVGALPHCIISNLGGSRNYGFQMSNFPGPVQSITLVGQRVQKIYFNIWCSNFIPIYLSVLSYNGEIQIVANGDLGLFQSEEILHGILEDIHKEVDTLVNEN